MTSDEAPELMFGAASDGKRSVVLYKEQFAIFLGEHPDASLVCYDAAKLHWLLEGYFKRSNKPEASKLLWAYSRESRLIDIMLLDQHVHRYQGRGGAVASRFHRLVRRCTGVKLPDDGELEQRISASSASGIAGRVSPSSRQCDSCLLQSRSPLRDASTDRRAHTEGGSAVASVLSTSNVLPQSRNLRFVVTTIDPDS